MTAPEIHVHVHLDALAELATQVISVKELVMNEAEQINALNAKVDDLITDVRTALEALAADRDALGPDGQAALDTLTAKVEAFDTEVGGDATPV
jgi:outer membrane murein-binding lipoprotein Lpp